MVRLGARGLLLDVQRTALLVELHDTVALRIANTMRKHGRARDVLRGGAQLLREAVTIEDVVAENECNMPRADEPTSDDERLSESFRPRLLGVGQGNAPLLAIPEQPLEQR